MTSATMTTDHKARTAAIGTAYVRDRKRFTDTVSNILFARHDVPGLDAGDADLPFAAGDWRFTFAGVPFRFTFVPAAASPTGKPAVAFAQIAVDGYDLYEDVAAVGTGQITFDAEGRTGESIDGFTLPGDAVPMFHALLAARFKNLSLDAPLPISGAVDERLTAVERELTALPERVAEAIRTA